MVRIALVGLGKMGISHLAIAKSHPDATLVAVCDTAGYVLDVLHKYTGIDIYTDYRRLMDETTLDAVIIATPSRLHGEMVRAALERNLHVFCEKPFCLDVQEGMELAAFARSKGLVNQVGYHCRFVSAFREAKRLLEAGTLGRIHHVRAEAYGPVVVRTRNTTWRGRKADGGGCLYDYACHVIDLVTYLVGPPERVSGTVHNKVFSREVEDEAYCTLHFANGVTGQLACNWSDDSCRKMETRLVVWGSNGRLAVDRQEVQIYLREASTNGIQQRRGWNVSSTTGLTDSPYYYLRGEEYTAQIDHFVQCIQSGRVETMSSFASAVATDRVISMMVDDVGQVSSLGPEIPTPSRLNIPTARKGFFARAMAGLS